MLQTNTGTENLKKCESNCTIRVTGASDAARNLPLASSGSRPTVISFRYVHGRGARRHPLCQDPWHQALALAHGIVGAASDEGRRHRACQQDRADGLGHDGQGRAIQENRIWWAADDLWRKETVLTSFEIVKPAPGPKSNTTVLPQRNSDAEAHSTSTIST